MATFALAVDIGGTFTDTLSIDDDGTVDLVKCPTDFQDLTLGVLGNVDRLGLDLGQAERIAHGTVVILDSLLQRSVAKTGLITTEGFRDVLEIMRTNRPEELIFDIQQQKPVAFVPRRLRFEVPGRLDFRGRILRALDEGKAEENIQALRKQGVEAIAVCLLHSYANDVHERALEEAIRRAVPGVSVSLSSEVAPQWREFERTSTTVLNACTMPIMQEYISCLEDRLGECGYGREILLMQSNGGLATAESVRNKPISTLFSSPAAGVIGASYLARTLGLDKVITYEHGGSRCFLSVLEDSVPSVKEEGSLEQWPIMTSVTDVKTIQAGANSAVWIDPRNVLRIGPQDVGTNPGPPCFHKGGEKPTATDASLLLGHINPDYFVAGQLRLDVNASTDVLQTEIADHYKMEIDQVALGILDLLVSIHAKGIREVSIEKGYDPRDLTLMAFGGAGGLYASMLARELGMHEAIVPFVASHMSCLGLLTADIRRDYPRTFVRALSEIQAENVNEAFEDLENTAVDQLEEEGIPRGSMEIIRSARVRYLGQEFTVKVPIPRETLTNEYLRTMSDEFSELHEKYYGFSTPEAPTEVVSLHVTALGHLMTPSIQKREAVPSVDARHLDKALKGTRSVWFRDAGEVTDCPTYERSKLRASNIVDGPAVVEEPYSTILLMPGDQMVVDEYLNAVIRTGR
jgi:N-methylhydantoinase A